jgi:hypothetical protein
LHLRLFVIGGEPLQRPTQCLALSAAEGAVFQVQRQLLRRLGVEIPFDEIREL